MAKDPWEDTRNAWKPIGIGLKGVGWLARMGMGAYQLNEQSKAYEEADLQRKRNAENDQRVKKSFADADKARQEMEKNIIPDALGDGRLGTLEDAAADDLLNPNGLFLGALSGTPLFYNGDAHLLNYGLTRSGKGTDLVLTNLAHVFNRSIVVNDIKSGENAYASAKYRASKGHKVIVLNPYNVDVGDLPTYRLNPFQRIIDKAQRGDAVGEDCLQMSMALVAPIKGEHAWISEGSQQILATWLEWCSCFYPDDCTLSNMWRFIFSDFDTVMEMVLDCQIVRLESQAKKLNQFRASEKQWAAYESCLTTALWCFAPDTPLALATETTDFDPAQMRHEKTTLYLVGDDDVLEASQQWVALTISAIVNACAQTQGQYPVTFIIDEMANLPYMAVIPKALTMYAGKGVQLFGLCQGRAALLDKGYNKDTINNFEDQSGLMSMWNVKGTDLIKDIEQWSGQKTVAVGNFNQGGGQVENAGRGMNHNKRPVLQAEDIARVGKGKQILRTNGAHLYVIDRVSWYMVEGWKDALQDPRPEHRYKK